MDLEKKFEPGLVNSVVYIVSMSMQVSTFVVNYRVSCYTFCCMLYLKFGRIVTFYAFSDDEYYKHALHIFIRLSFSKRKGKGHSFCEFFHQSIMSNFLRHC